MKFQSTLAFAVAAFALGAAFAAPSAPLAAQPVQGTPLERLEAAEKRLADLENQLAALKGVKPVATDKDKPADTQGVEAIDKQLQSVLAYLGAQAEAAKRLDVVLKDSDAKGFTFGINPDSRIVMLHGFADFTTTLQTDVPTAKKPTDPQATAIRR
jgi:hypothetical protein